MPERILILGASARAAAASARRAGLEPFSIDLFADADTRRLGDGLRCPFDQYPHGLFALARKAPAMPWMYTGGLENSPDLIAELAKERELRGNRPDTLQKVRDPNELDTILTKQGLAYPALLRGGAIPSGALRWVRKPIKSSAGRGVRFATESDLRNTTDPDSYLQEFIDGSSFSTVFHTTAEGTRVVGSSRQLIGVSWLHAEPFAYCGNVLPFALKAEALREVQLQAVRLMKKAKLTGCWGIDSVLGTGRWAMTDSGSQQRPYLVEVNPRYTASAELFEFTSGTSILNPKAKARSAIKSRAIGKAIYYAPLRIVTPASGPWDDSLRHAADAWRRPDFADIPNAGEVVEKGQPFITIFAEAESEAACLQRLQARAKELDQLFGATSWEA